MRKARKKERTAAAREAPEKAPESRETVTALGDVSIGTPPQSVGDTTAATPDRERIALRAYELYLSRGGGEGSAVDDWLAAEREFTSTGRDRGSE